ncbi:MAG: C45 family peptidase [Deltaproteobacteria bacterium]|jgi:isopenicillin-N N-acyltransferase-like protein|nr:C45 family peptidase [Deltaproteobacteria bacterium]
MDLPVYKYLSGRGLALGQAHGETFRDKIKAFTETFVDLNLSNIPAKVTKADLVDLCMINVPFLTRYAPELFEEMAGIAAGANVALPDIVLLNCFLELNDLRAPLITHRVFSQRDWGCTTFNLKPRATSEGKAYVGQTYDMERYFADYNVVLKITYPDRSVRLVYTLAGVLGLNGINDSGLAVVINKLVPTDSRAGVIYPFLVRQALDQKRVGDALSALAFAPRASGTCFQLSSADGLAFCLETTASKHALIDFRHGQAHANHYLAPELKPYEADWLTQGGSYVRQQVAQESLDDFQGRITLDHLKTLCQDHKNRPFSVCAHQFEDDDEHKAMATISAVILEPSLGVMHYADCHPCEQTFTTFSLA